MAPITPGQTHLCDKPTPEEHLRIGETLFGIAFVSDTNRLEEFSEYFEYYREETRLLGLPDIHQRKKNWDLPAETHDELLKVVRILQGSDLAATRADIRIKVNEELDWDINDEDGLNEIIDLAARVWLMLNFRQKAARGLSGGRTCLQWDDQTALATFISTQFPKTRTELTPSQSRLSPHFTAAFMKHICGLELGWTTSLKDHLYLDREKKKLWVFCDKQFLRAHLTISDPQSVKSTVTPHPHIGSPLPYEMVRETTRTLDLLFPLWDSDTQHLLENKKTTLQRLVPMQLLSCWKGSSKNPPVLASRKFYRWNAQPRNLDLKEFDYWRDRLLELYEEVYSAPPVSWAQLWGDRRDPQKFWTFWIALVILLLTIWSVVTGTIQTWASIKSLSN